MEITQLFNTSVEFYVLLSSTTNTFTGSWFMTFALVILMLVLIAGFFRMPEILYFIPIIPVILIFSTVDPQLRVLLGIMALFFGYLISQIIPAK